MSTWNTLFSILQKEHPTGDEKGGAQTVADEAVKCHHDLVDNKTTKTYVAQYHPVAQYLRLHPGLLRKLIPHWVEQSHQSGYKIEQQFRHISGTEKKANCKAGKRCSSNNSDIQNQVEHVREKNARGPRCSYRGGNQQTDVTPSPQACTQGRA